MSRKIIFQPDYWKSPANNLVKSLQERLKYILMHPDQFGIKDAFSLKTVMEAEAATLSLKHKRSSLSDITFRVHTLEGYDNQFFEMEHKNDNIALSAQCVFDMGGRQFYPELNKEIPGIFGKIVIEF